MKLYKKQSRTTLRHNFLTKRVINCWNSLPKYVVSASNISLFKKQLDFYWEHELGYGYEQRPST